MIPRIQQIEEELSRFQPSVREEFRRAVDAISRDLSEMELVDWAQHGLDIAQQSVRSWETASEYYRTTPQVKPYLNPSQLSDWGRSGAVLCLDSPTLGTAFFRASTKSAGKLEAGIRSRMGKPWPETVQRDMEVGGLGRQVL